MKNTFGLSLFFLLLGNFLAAQTTVTGTLTDTADLPLPYANVIEVNTKNGTVSDDRGNFSITVKSDTASLQFSYVGCQTQVIALAGRKKLQVRLAAAELIICEVISRSSPINVTLPVPQNDLTQLYLQRDNDLSPAPVLNRVPGLYMHSGALNTNRITIRGVGNRSPFSTTKIRAYLDEIPLTSGDGETAVEDIDFSLIEKIKVYKGPTASIYGAGLGGMLHLQTPELLTSRKLTFNTKTTVGSFGLLRNATNISFRPHDKLQMRLNLNRTQRTGYRANNRYERDGSAFLLKFTPTYKHKTSLIANAAAVKAFIPSSLNREDYLNNPRAAAANWAAAEGNEDYRKTLLGITHRSILAENIGTKNFGNSTALFTTFRENEEVRPFNTLRENSRVFGLRTAFNLTENGRENEPFPLLSVGTEIFRENYEWQTLAVDNAADTLSDNRENRNYYNLFAQYYYGISPQWYLLAGVNYNKTRYDYDDLAQNNGQDLSGDYEFDGIVSPRLGLTWHRDYRWSVFATVSHGFSPPSLSETLTPDGAINPDIQPEQGWNFEVGSRGKSSGGKLQYEVSVYTMFIDDLLVARRVAEDQFVGLNAGKTRHSGAELFFSYEVLRKNRQVLDLWTTYTFADYKFVDFQDGDDDYSGNELTGTPPHHLNLGADYAHDGGFYGNLNYKYLAAFPIRDDNSIYSEAYSLLNCKFGYLLSAGKKWSFDFSGGINNVLNEKYASQILINAGSFGGNAPRYYYPGERVNWYFGVNITCNLR